VRIRASTDPGKPISILTRGALRSMVWSSVFGSRTSTDEQSEYLGA
jgi:hypothetical protein